jgi:hypothetical protein
MQYGRSLSPVSAAGSTRRSPLAEGYWFGFYNKPSYYAMDELVGVGQRDGQGRGLGRLEAGVANKFYDKHLVLAAPANGGPERSGSRDAGGTERRRRRRIDFKRNLYCPAARGRTCAGDDRRRERARGHPRSFTNGCGGRSLHNPTQASSPALQEDLTPRREPRRLRRPRRLH